MFFLDGREVKFQSLMGLHGLRIAPGLGGEQPAETGDRVEPRVVLRPEIGDRVARGAPNAGPRTRERLLDPDGTRASQQTGRIAQVGATTTARAAKARGRRGAARGGKQLRETRDRDELRVGVRTEIDDVPRGRAERGIRTRPARGSSIPTARAPRRRRRARPRKPRGEVSNPRVISPNSASGTARPEKPLAEKQPQRRKP
jgi:hypothetical protein